MGAADIIPGVSGGTIALISGIYEHLINAISQINIYHVFAALKLPVYFWNAEKRKENLNTLLEVQWGFLLSLILGIATGIGTMMGVIPAIMDAYPFYTYSFFFGLIVVSLTIPYRHMNHNVPEIALLVIFSIVTYFIVGYSSVSGATIKFTVKNKSGEIIGTHSLKTDNNGRFEISVPSDITDRNGIVEGDVISPDGRNVGSFNLVANTNAGSHSPLFSATDTLSENSIYIRKTKVVKTDNSAELWIKGVYTIEGDDNIPFLFFSGFVAISAMILPGISGAYILVLLGEYRHVLESGHKVLYGVFGALTGHGLPDSFMSDLTVLLVIGLGILVGIFSFVRILKYLLANHHSLTMAALTGIMAGSLRKIWPMSYLEGETDLFSIAFAIFIAIFGALLIFVMEWISRKLADPEPPV